MALPHSGNLWPSTQGDDTLAFVKIEMLVVTSCASMYRLFVGSALLLYDSAGMSQ